MDAFFVEKLFNLGSYFHVLFRVVASDMGGSDYFSARQ
jgi:hypothetical protein